MKIRRVALEESKRVRSHAYISHSGEAPGIITNLIDDPVTGAASFQANAVVTKLHAGVPARPTICYTVRGVSSPYQNRSAHPTSGGSLLSLREGPSKNLIFLIAWE